MRAAGSHGVDLSALAEEEHLLAARADHAPRPFWQFRGSEEVKPGLFLVGYLQAPFRPLNLDRLSHPWRVSTLPLPVPSP